HRRRRAPDALHAGGAGSRTEARPRKRSGEGKEEARRRPHARDASRAPPPVAAEGEEAEEAFAGEGPVAVALVTAGDVRLEVAEAGEGGPPFVFIHGLSCDITSGWAPQF